MSEDLNDDYAQDGEVNNYELTLPEKIDVTIKALGTMVIMPDYEEPDLANIGGKKRYLGGVQKPILEGENRLVAENKLVELIRQL